MKNFERGSIGARSKVVEGSSSEIQVTEHYTFCGLGRLQLTNLELFSNDILCHDV
jgi:hypothetical protein